MLYLTYVTQELVGRAVEYLGHFLEQKDVWFARAVLVLGHSVGIYADQTSELCLGEIRLAAEFSQAVQMNHLLSCRCVFIKPGVK